LPTLHQQVGDNKDDNDNIQAVVLNGIDATFDWTFLNEHLVEGTIFIPEDTIKSNRIFISDYMPGCFN
jgi:hypothetical protein